MKRAAEYRIRARYSLSGRYGTIIAAQVISEMIIFTAIFGIVLVMIPIAFVLMGLSMPNSANAGYSGMPFPVVLLSIATAVLLFIMIIAQALLSCGVLKLICKAWKKEPDSLGDMFYGFRGKAPLRIIGISFLIGLMEIVFMIPYQICIIAIVFQDNVTPILVLLLIPAYLLLLAGIVFVTLFFGLSMYVFLDQPELGAVQCMKASFRLTRGRRLNLFCLYFSFIGWMVLGMMSFGIGLLWIYPYIHCTVFHFYEDLKLEKTGQPQGVQPAGS